MIITVLAINVLAGVIFGYALRGLVERSRGNLQ